MCLIVSKLNTHIACTKLRDFIDEHRIEILNFAGPGESGGPAAFVRCVIDEGISVRVTQ